MNRSQRLAFMFSTALPSAALVGCGAPPEGETVGHTNSAVSTVAPAAPSGCGAIEPGQGLTRGQAYRSCDGRFELTMQTDGNLVLYMEGRALWATGTWGTDAEVAIMQTDGNLVVYGPSQDAKWASNTWGHPGAWLALQNDGNLVVYDNVNFGLEWSETLALWASNTSGHAPLPSGVTYAGCYSDSPQRALSVELIASGATIESCTAAAESAGYSYAGLQYYGQCFAGNGLGYTQEPDSSCNTPCTANGNETCGGAWLNSVYALPWPSAPACSPPPPVSGAGGSCATNFDCDTNLLCESGTCTTFPRTACTTSAACTAGSYCEYAAVNNVPGTFCSKTVSGSWSGWTYTTLNVPWLDAESAPEGTLGYVATVTPAIAGAPSPTSRDIVPPCPNLLQNQTLSMTEPVSWPDTESTNYAPAAEFARALQSAGCLAPTMVWGTGQGANYAFYATCPNEPGIAAIVDGAACDGVIHSIEFKSVSCQWGPPSSPTSFGVIGGLPVGMSVTGQPLIYVEWDPHGSNVNN